LFAGWSSILLAVSLAAVVFILYMQFRGMEPAILGTIALGLLLGGAMGNVADRMFLGYVRDFIDVHLSRYRWPTFNLADAALCVGAGLLILQMMRDEAAARRGGGTGDQDIEEKAL